MTWPLVLLLTLPAQPTSTSELVRVERALREANLAVDGPGLVAYLQAQIPTPEDDALLKRLVRELGDDDFDRREAASAGLVKAGRKALGYLKPAAASTDLEVARRVSKCLETIVDSPLATLLPGIVRLLVERRPEGAVPVLLGYLPVSGEPAVEDALADALRVLGVRDGKLEPALSAALKDAAPLRRATAALVVGDTNDRVRAQTLLGPLLRDAEPRVRFEAAQALARCGDPAGVTALVALFETAPRDLAWQAEESLVRLVPPGAILAPPLGTASDAERHAAHTAWETWWTRTGSKGWKPRPTEPYLGRTLVVEYDGNPGGGAIYEVGRDGRKRWQLDGLAGPNDVQSLPNGRLLVAERNADRVTEFDRAGKIVWSQRTANSPIAAQRLDTGATLIVTFSELTLYAADGTKGMTFGVTDGLRHARALPDGTFVAITAKGEVLEVSAAGKQLRALTPAQHATGAGYWAAVERLTPGKYLTALSGANKLLEIDATGKITREFNANSPVSAVRLRNGHTLITSFEGRQVIELDHEGKEVWQTPTRGRPFYAVRY